MTLNILVTQLRDTSVKPKTGVGGDWVNQLLAITVERKMGSRFLISYTVSASEGGIDHFKTLLLWFYWPVLNAWQGYEIHYHYLDLIKPNRSISTY